MKRLGIIGGTGASVLLPGNSAQGAQIVTPWGSPSGPLLAWTQGNVEVFFLPRHGHDAQIPPHRVNYRANVHALRECRVDAVIGINAVGGISPQARPGRVVLPDQLVDYTWGREHTFCDGSAAEPLRHVEFEPPFDEPLRGELAGAARRSGVEFLDGGVYGVTQGPRLETAAEINRLERDGCHIVGMTAMPEASLAREAALPYAILALVVNHAAGRLPAGVSIHEQLGQYVEQGMAQINVILQVICGSR